jgi:hypothetical protein
VAERERDPNQLAKLKKIDNHAHMVAIPFMHYNFARLHKTLRVTPAMEARLADHVWSLEEIASRKLITMALA